MLNIDSGLLAEVGLDKLPTWESDLLLAHIYETLEMRVGIKLASDFSDQQLDEFEVYFEKRDDAGAFKWLEMNVPNYKDVVAAEFDTLKRELVGEVSTILEISQRNQLAPEAPTLDPGSTEPDEESDLTESLTLVGGDQSNERRMGSRGRR